jgi:hypothetical protein
MRHVRLAAATAIVLGSLTTAARADLELITSGTFDAGVTVGATVLAAPAAYTATAFFDPTVGIEFQPGGYVFPFSLFTFDVAGVGTVAVDPSGGAYVFLGTNDSGSYAAGLSNSVNTMGFGAGFTTSSDPAFTPAAPTPTVFGGFFESAIIAYSFALVGGGVLSDPNTTINFDPVTAEIINPAAVPEPSALALMGLGSAALAVSARRRRRAVTG